MMGAIKRFYDHVNATVTSSGTNTVTLTYGVAPAAYVAGDVYVFIVGTTNTGSTTINVNSLGAKTVKLNGANLAGGELKSGEVVIVAYDGTNFRLVATSGHRASMPARRRTSPVRGLSASLTPMSPSTGIPAPPRPPHLLSPPLRVSGRNTHSFTATGPASFTR